MNFINPKNKKKITIMVLAIVVALLIIGTISCYYRSSIKTDQGIDEKKYGQQNIIDSDPAKESPGGKEQPQREVEKPRVQSYEGSIADGLTGLINYKGVVGDNLVIRITIDQPISGGSCNLKLMKNEKTIQRAVDIFRNPSSATCQGFDVPTAELESGLWSVIVTVNSGGKTMSITDTVNI